ncbi:MAG: hypothetical protein SFU56_16635 [Capsulimonadales bacterium]|nr:hypothetical protein [Capsulimonadales bacterium]
MKNAVIIDEINITSGLISRLSPVIDYDWIIGVWHVLEPTTNDEPISLPDSGQTVKAFMATGEKRSYTVKAVRIHHGVPAICLEAQPGEIPRLTRLEW